MKDADKLKINTILQNSSAGVLTLADVVLIDNSYSEFINDKSYYDATLLVLTTRKATNTMLRKFYDYAKINNIAYNDMLASSSDLFIIGGSNV